MDQKLVERLRRIAVVGMVGLLCAGSPASASNGKAKGHNKPNCPGKSCDSHGRPNCPGKSCDSNGNAGGKLICTADADCPADQGCRHGRCHKDICTTDADCSAGDGCRNGKCHKDVCSTDADCDAGDGCRNGKCHKDVCSTDADCDAGDSCRNGKCHKDVCSTDADCNTGETCSNGKCSDNPNATNDGGLPTPTEVCGDCIDNDGNGLTDFEDPACCSETQEFAMTLSRGMIKSAGETSKVQLRSLLMGNGMTSILPTVQDVLLQLRPADGKDIFCTRIPATAFVQHQSNFNFVARRTPTVGAKGLDRVTLKIRPDGTVRFRTRGKRVQITNPEQGAMQLTLGFLTPGNPAANRCSSTMASFQNVRQLTLIAR